MIKSQVDGWSDWSTKTLPANVREAAEWLISNGYENESDVKNAFYNRQTSQMSDDFNAEENDNAAIVRVAKSYLEKELKAGRQIPPNQEMKNSKENDKMENTVKDPLFDEGAEEQATPGESAEQNGRFTPEGYIKLADAEFLSAMREGHYPEIVDAIGDLDYSVRNVMLIKSQFPGATNVGGMNMWNYHKRSIIKDSKSIKILAPKFGNGNGNSGDEEKDKAEKATGYKISYVFDVSQTQGDELRQMRCDQAFLGTHYDGVKNTAAAMAGDYTFVEGAKSNSVDYANKQVNIKESSSKEDTLKAMIYSVACIRTEGRDREAGKDISQGRAMFNELRESAIAHIVSRRIGLGDARLKTLDFSGFEDEALSKVANDLNRVKSVAHGMIKRVENYVSEVRAEEALQAAGDDTALSDIFSDDFTAPTPVSGIPDEMSKASAGEM